VEEGIPVEDPSPVEGTPVVEDPWPLAVVEEGLAAVVEEAAVVEDDLTAVVPAAVVEDGLTAVVPAAVVDGLTAVVPAAVVDVHC